MYNFQLPTIIGASLSEPQLVTIYTAAALSVYMYICIYPYVVHW